jgi:protein tyrosine/serine phosphatase
MINELKLAVLNKVFSPVKSSRSAVYATLLIYVVVFSTNVITVASPDNKSDRSEKSSANRESGEIAVDVNNFGKVTDFFYRGAQPKGEEYHQLAVIGIKTVIDLRDDPKDYAKNLAERAGLKYINFPMGDKEYPASDAASKFLTLIGNQENWPVYVHCAGGRHRTGIMTAVFRLTIQGWDINRAYGEMKNYDFYTRWGHKPMKEFIFDYYRDLQKRHDNSNLAPAPTN